ncbi:MAG: twin-arginine translocation signal domain-containing protein [Sphingobacteriaceae bacterium]|nr:MAG: twin-arginine translocation signal domain-containing protein [Sphingobacteriaceae bacterium]
MIDKFTSRRGFIKTGALAGVSALTITEIVTSAFTEAKVSKITLAERNTFLFQGDSITDAGRRKEDMNPNNPAALGSGYAMIAGSEILFKNAEKNLKVYNKGISGNKVYQLAERWDADCLNLKPDVLSILIGVNDYWHKHDGKYNGTISIYKNDYKALLEHTRKALPNVKLIIAEPFAVPDVKAVDKTWYPDFPEYQQAAREMAQNFDAVFIPLQSVFDKAIKTAPGSYWTADGVHPTLAGAQLMAHSWMEILKG